MRTRKEAYNDFEDGGSAYEAAVKDVARKMLELIKNPVVTEHDKGWNDALAELSRNIVLTKN
jgi:hypothetical protein